MPIRKAKSSGRDEASGKGENKDDMNSIIRDARLSEIATESNLIMSSGLTKYQLNFDPYDFGIEYEEEDLREFLDRYRAREGEPWNVRDDEGNRWLVDYRSYFAFLILYSRVSAVCDLKYSYFERPPQICPITLIFRLTCRSPVQDIETFITQDTKTVLLTCLDQMIRKITCTSHTSKLDLAAVVSMGSVIREDSLGDDVNTYTFKIMYPNFRIDREFIRHAVIPELKEEIASLDIFRGLQFQPINLSHEGDFIDDSIYSSDDSNLEGIPMECSQYFISDACEGMVSTSKEVNLIDSYYDIFDPSLHKLVLDYETDKLLDESIDPEVWRPIVTSVEYCTRKRMTPAGSHYIKPDFDFSNFGSVDTSCYDPTDYKKSIISDMLELWRPSRINDVTEWKTIGEIIYDAYNGDLHGCVVWIQITVRMIQELGRKVPDFIRGSVRTACQREYIKFTKGKNTIITAMWVAREDNPHRYNKWHWEWCRPAFERAIKSGSHSDVAVAFHRAAMLDFVCMNINDRPNWYRISNGYFEEASSSHVSVMFTVIMSTYLQRILVSILRQIRIDQLPDEGPHADVIEWMSAIMNDVKRVGFKRDIITESRGLFENNNVIKYMDTNYELLGVKNGVLVATLTGIKFRQSRPEDYVSKRANGGYYEDMFSADHDIIKFIRDWDQKALHEPDLVQFYRDWKSSLLRGRNPEKILLIGTGCGNNSKTSKIQALTNTLGDYAVTLGANAFTSIGRDANGPSPAWARTENIRLLTAEEFDNNISLKTAILNLVTGNGRMYCRRMKENGKDIKIVFKTFFAMNKMPTFSDPSEAIRNRVVVIPFDSVFKVNAPKDPEEQVRRRIYEVDPNFDEKTEDMMSGFLWDMVDNYPNYIANRLRVRPEASKRATEAYWEKADIVYRFLRTNMTPREKNTPDKSMIVTYDEMYTSFKLWYKFEIPEGRIPSSDNVFDSVVYHWGQPDVPNMERAWYGSKMKSSSGKNQTSDRGALGPTSAEDEEDAPTTKSNPGGITRTSRIGAGGTSTMLAKIANMKNAVADYEETDLSTISKLKSISSALPSLDLSADVHAQITG